MSGPSKQDFLRRVQERGVEGDVFTFAEIRKELEVDPSDETSHNRLWNWLRTLLRHETIKELDDDRKRHKRYYVKDLDALNREFVKAVAPRSSNGSKARSSTSAVGRFSRLEARVDDAVESLEEVEGVMEAIQDMKDRQEQIERKLDSLIAIWS